MDRAASKSAIADEMDSLTRANPGIEEFGEVIGDIREYELGPVRVHSVSFNKAVFPGESVAERVRDYGGTQYEATYCRPIRPRSDHTLSSGLLSTTVGEKLEGIGQAMMHGAVAAGFGVAAVLTSGVGGVATSVCLGVCALPFAADAVAGVMRFFKG